MSILTTVEVASFLTIDPASPGLQEAIDQAEALIAGKMGLATIQLSSYLDESISFGSNAQMVVPKHGPIRAVSKFLFNGEDKLSEVEIGFGSWCVVWADAYPVNFYRVRGFPRGSKVVLSYSAGWTNSSGAYPLPLQVGEYAKSMTGLVYQNLLGSGVYDTKLGDMTVKIQREVLAKNLEVYDDALRFHARPLGVR
jgi:hypothetical protein